MILKINNIEHTLKYNVRTLITYEKIADKPFSVNGLSEWALLAYASLLSGTPDTDLTLEEFLEISPEELKKIIDWLIKQLGIDSQLKGEQEEKKGSKKKK